ncbi:hypothetical protein H8K52_06680 [Undibacterium seohonense]|uniref:Transposase n=1 Tax=Undibacterium seohonense TaxID=1344950 RepID=A0ABR6X2Y4_9BURK|nr:hypothetical protein [Undibacterium seohonense]MBC3807028.1 hypothetical protein [Undibacterium seohonense]
MKKICELLCDEQIEEIRVQMKIAKKPRKSQTTELYQYKTQILSWANRKNVSKKMLVLLIQRHLNVTVTTDRVYHFVKKSNGGVWPNSRKKELSDDKF